MTAKLRVYPEHPNPRPSTAAAGRASHRLPADDARWTAATLADAKRSALATLSPTLPPPS
ncbi:MAG: hypothetical protein U1F68_13150 [Gammaproteobacteria bacterium]